jgi:hypothetical protein
MCYYKKSLLGISLRIYRNRHNYFSYLYKSTYFWKIRDRPIKHNFIFVTNLAVLTHEHDFLAISAS